MKISVIFDSIEEAADYGFGFNTVGETAQAPTQEKEKAAKPDKKPAKPEKVVAPAAEETGDEATLDSLKDVFQKLVKGGKRDGALELLKKYKVKKIHEVAEEDMESMQNDAMELLDAEDEDDELGI
jgi:hypothetical protein